MDDSMVQIVKDIEFQARESGPNSVILINWNSENGVSYALLCPPMLEFYSACVVGKKKKKEGGALNYKGKNIYFSKY